ncbi:DUF6088 family protein [Chakrabartyella piscis]|uniref:DUF6088 family protein n=1 Tax=Chakrabartyella piscis TaxID=2918914 RepID=UPI002958A536|nr:DUF6088 family protein [Chakrabartyella piscis]
MNIKYSEYMGSVIEAFPVGIPIFTDTVVKIVSDKIEMPVDDLKSIVNLNLKRLADNHIIERIQKGVYYKPKMTAFGKTKPPIELMIHETCIQCDGEKIGYIGAETLLHDFGLTSLVPKNKVIVTNKYRVKVPKENHIILKKPVTEITEDNAKYLQLIDVVAMLSTEYIDVENPEQIIRERANKLVVDKLTMIKIAKKYYPLKVLVAVLEIILEDDYEFTQ